MKETKRSWKTTLAWVGGIIFVLAGLGSMSKSIASGILLIIGGALLLPPVSVKITQISPKVKAIITIAALVIGITLMPASNGEKISSASIQDSDVQEELSSTDSPTEAPTAEPTEEPTPEPTVEPTEDPTPEPSSNYDIGDVIEFKNQTFTVKEVRKIDSDNEFLQPDDGNYFIGIMCLIENTGNETIISSSMLDFALYDEDGMQYDTGIFSDTKGTVDGEIPAGKKLKGEIAFEVPEGLTEFELRYSAGLLGKTVSIDVSL